MDEYGRFDKRAGRYMDQEILNLGFKGLRYMDQDILHLGFKGLRYMDQDILHLGFKGLRYMDQDILHLGFKGLRVFATCIKNAVINYKKRNFRSIHSNQVNNRYQGQDRFTALNNSLRGESLPPHTTR